MLRGRKKNKIHCHSTIFVKTCMANNDIIIKEAQTELYYLIIAAECDSIVDAISFICDPKNKFSPNPVPLSPTTKFLWSDFWASPPQLFCRGGNRRNRPRGVGAYVCACPSVWLRHWLERITERLIWSRQSGSDRLRRTYVIKHLCCSNPGS